MKRLMRDVFRACAVGAVCCTSTVSARRATSPPAGHSATQPSLPTTQPAGPGAPGPQLPPEFQILRSRNPFAHGKGGPGGAGAPGGPEAMFVLRGVAQDGGQYTAFIEDVAAKRVMQLSAGSPIATGRVKSVDIDTIDFEVMRHSRRIEVGQNLAGQVVPPTPASKPAGPPPTGGPGPAKGPPPGAPGGPMPPGARPRKGGPPGAEPQPEGAPQPPSEQ